MVSCTIRIITKSLNIKDISKEQDYRHKLINDLHNRQFTDKQIADYLNTHNIKTPKGKRYYSELVFVTRKKINLRANKELDVIVSLENIQVLFN